MPQRATIWFFLREVDYEHVMEMYDAAKLMAQGAALMTGTEIDTIMTVGSAWNRHFSKPVAEVAQVNIERVGLPEWSDDDIAMANALQREMGQTPRGLATRVPGLRGPIDLDSYAGGGSDDIGDVSWNMPTVTMRYPANMPGGPRPQLGERDRDGHPGGPQRLAGGCQGAGAHPPRPLLGWADRRSGVGLLHDRADSGDDVHAVHHARRSAGDLDE